MNVIQLMHTLLATSTFVRLLGGFGLTWICDLWQKKLRVRLLLATRWWRNEKSIMKPTFFVWLRPEFKFISPALTHCVVMKQSNEPRARSDSWWMRNFSLETGNCENFSCQAKPAKFESDWSFSSRDVAKFSLFSSARNHLDQSRLPMIFELFKARLSLVCLNWPSVASQRARLDQHKFSRVSSSQRILFNFP